MAAKKKATPKKKAAPKKAPPSQVEDEGSAEQQQGPKKLDPQAFLLRNGTSGRQIEGVVFSDNFCVVRRIGKGKPATLWDSFEAFREDLGDNDGGLDLVMSPPPPDQDDEPDGDGPKKLNPQSFIMVRHHDETGVSGTGRVLEGCVMSDNTTVTRWTSGRRCTHLWDAYESFREVHIDSHPDNKTEIIWLPRKKED